MCIIICIALFVFIGLTGYSCCVVSGEADDMANEYSRKKLKEMQEKENSFPKNSN